MPAASPHMRRLAPKRCASRIAATSSTRASARAAAAQRHLRPMMLWLESYKRFCTAEEGLERLADGEWKTALLALPQIRYRHTKQGRFYMGIRLK
jgi:hypothetical protein